ncbi:hypothetical protein [Nocardioides sp. cx-173]|uniref:hypothetical protein n=1 Tax=Nocardioides sp. cx-173 TaxID=2898796 RepID=UPI001E3537AB|nr:hypothetical protein [Nocardioides sp. cx-173]MCD4524334.1 hypothetical protein [Nocardioides sp. cx-173]UGB41723.1 hypothetical protein LQ940_20510 [Nocardioides sp. cx-173]
MASDDPLQTWELRVEGRSHRVEVYGSVSRRIQWWVDGDLVLERRSADDKPRFSLKERPELGSLTLRFSGLGKPRRATVVAPGQLAGIDLDPEPGSPAAAYEDRVRAHPRRYALIETAGGVAAVVVPILVTVLLARLAFSIAWPDWDLPRVPFPDLPDLPSLPSVPLPDLPNFEISLPGWVREVLDKSEYVLPIVIAYVLARREIARRRKQDELRARARDRGRDAE